MKKKQIFNEPRPIKELIAEVLKNLQLEEIKSTNKKQFNILIITGESQR